MLSLLTATGARPQAFTLCQRWMAAQDYSGRVLWVIVDDGPEPAPIDFHRDGWEVVRLRPQPLWEPGQNTQARNLRAGLDLCSDRLAIIEDDDYYAPDWLTTVSEQLEIADLVGESESLYFNVKTRVCRSMGNTKHASLCATAMRGAAIDRFRQVCADHMKTIDFKLWEHPSRHLFHGNRVVGIKGLPGRENIGVGRRLTGRADPNLSRLRAVIGKDADAYAGY